MARSGWLWLRVTMSGVVWFGLFWGGHKLGVLLGGPAADGPARQAMPWVQAFGSYGSSAPVPGGAIDGSGSCPCTNSCRNEREVAEIGEPVAWLPNDSLQLSRRLVGAGQ